MQEFSSSTTGSSRSCCKAIVWTEARGISATKVTYPLDLLGPDPYEPFFIIQQITKVPYDSVVMTMPHPWWASHSHCHLTSYSQILSLYNGTIALIELLFLQCVVFCFRRHDYIQNTVDLCSASPIGACRRLSSILSTMGTSSTIGPAGSSSTRFRADCNTPLTC